MKFMMLSSLIKGNISGNSLSPVSDTSSNPMVAMMLMNGIGGAGNMFDNMFDFSFDAQDAEEDAESGDKA